MHHVGVDLGGRDSQVCARGPDGSIVLERRCKNTELRVLMRSIPPSRIVMETCSESFAVAEMARSAGPLLLERLSALPDGRLASVFRRPPPSSRDRPGPSAAPIHHSADSLPGLLPAGPPQNPVYPSLERNSPRWSCGCERHSCAGAPSVAQLGRRLALVACWHSDTCADTRSLCRRSVLPGGAPQGRHFTITGITGGPMLARVMLQPDSPCQNGRTQPRRTRRSAWCSNDANYPGGPS